EQGRLAAVFLCSGGRARRASRCGTLPRSACYFDMISREGASGSGCVAAIGEPVLEECATALADAPLPARPCCAALAVSRIAWQCLQTATPGFTFSPQAGQSTMRIGT